MQAASLAQAQVCAGGFELTGGRSVHNGLNALLVSPETTAKPVNLSPNPCTCHQHSELLDNQVHK